MIAEGIETQEEFSVVEKLGITHVQGYYFARPNKIPLPKINPALFVTQTHHDDYVLFNSTSVAQISKYISPVSAETPISDVMNLFQHDNDLTVLPLVDENFASGIIFRDVFLSKLFSSRYGMELHGKKPIKSFIDQTPLTVDCNTSIESVSKQLTSTMRNDQAFIITRHGEYQGIGTLLALLEEITCQQIDNAKHANPLTLLPGSVPMNNYINQLLTEKTPFAVGYFDLDNFKPFNDVYGYSAGDDIIKQVADVLNKFVTPEFGRIGHIGGDDFIVVFTCEHWLFCCEQILTTFKYRVPNYYKSEDIEAGGICAENRQGEKCFYPMISLSIGLVDPLAISHCHSHVDISDLAAEAKKQAKKIEGNSYFVNKRHAFKSQSEKNNSVVKLHAVS